MSTEAQNKRWGLPKDAGPIQRMEYIVATAKDEAIREHAKIVLDELKKSQRKD